MIQQFLLQFTGALNRRRAYAPTHPMVLEAEARLFACLTTLLADRDGLTLGVARDELLIDGAPYVTKSTYARELATRLHRRGVGAITIERGVLLTQLSDLLAWLASERDFLPFAPTRSGGVHVTTIGYDHLVLDDTLAAAESSVSMLWRTLAALAEAGVSAEGHSGRVGPIAGASGRGTGTGDGAGDGAGDRVGFGTGSGSGIGSGHGPTLADAPPIDPALEAAIADAVARGDAVYVDGALTGVDSGRVLDALKASLANPSVARRTAVALADVAATARGASPEVRALVGTQLSGLLAHLGESSFAPIISSLGDRSARTAFVEEVADALPLGAVVQWIQAAATANEQQMSHQILRIMAKLSMLANTPGDGSTEDGFREAARDLVQHWDLADPNPTEHVELLDRIARFERSDEAGAGDVTVLGTSVVEEARIVQMALELDFVGEDTTAAANALVASGEAPRLLEWAAAAGGSTAARWLTEQATSETAVRQLLLTEPVDRLEARAVLQMLTPASAEVLLDVLEAAQARGTRMIVRQRLAEFGPAITPQLVARLEHAPWFLVRNILTVLQEFDTDATGATAEHLFRLLDHPQEQVRIEALRVLVRGSATRDMALRRALRDESERVVLSAIQTVTELADAGTLPSPALAAQLMSFVQAGAQSDPVRARAVRAVALVRRGDVRDWLTTLVTKRTPFLRRLKLVEPTQTAATALQMLQRMYGGDPAVARVLALAAKSSGDGRWQVRDVAPERAS